MSKSDFVCDSCYKNSLLHNSNTFEDSSPVESEPYTCSLCNRNFPKSFNDEVDVGHSDQTKQLVEENRYELSTSGDDALSKASTHSDDEKNLCPLCNTEFGTLYDLLNHSCNNSVQQKINECETNEKLSSNLCNEKHLTLHEEVDEVPSEQRHFLDDSRYELSTSEDVKSNTHLESTNHSCPLCNAELVTLKDFLNHNCDDSVQQKTNKCETYEKHSSNLCYAECLAFYDEVDEVILEQRRHFLEDSRYASSASENANSSTHLESEKHLCPSCNAKFATLHDLLNHSCNDSVQQMTNECEANAKLSSNLCNEEHLTLHEEVDEVPLEQRRHFPDDSRYELSASDDVKSSTHSENEKHFCPSCNAKFATLQDLLNHSCNDSVQQKANGCETYEKHSSKLRNEEYLTLYDEVDAVSLEQTRRHFLDDSRYELTTSEDVKSSTHLEIEKPSSPSCNVEFLPSYDLENHKCNSVQQKTNECKTGKTNDKSYHCEICDKRFPRKRGLDRHVVVHTGEKPFECEVCGNKFSCKENLERHKPVHSRGKFECEVCGKQYTRKKKLERHKPVHSREKFECEVCRKQYTRKKRLESHMSTHLRE